jgi:hypothetical protein
LTFASTKLVRLAVPKCTDAGDIWQFDVRTHRS